MSEDSGLTPAAVEDVELQIQVPIELAVETAVETPPKGSADVVRWLERLQQLFSHQLKGLPRDLLNMQFGWHVALDGTWAAVCYEGVDSEADGDPSPYYFGFSGFGETVQSITIAQEGRWLGVSVNELERHLGRGLRRGSMSFRYAASFLERQQAPRR